MLDQNTTLLLSTLFGGLLAIAGGFIATYITQFLSNKTEKKKLLREKIEETYILVTEIGNLTNLHYMKKIENFVFKDQKALKEFYNETYFNGIRQKLDKMNMIMELYLPEMKSIYTEYLEIVTQVNQQIYSSDIDEANMNNFLHHFASKTAQLHLALQSQIALQIR